ncbi:hypothetical protein F511_11936 [Dorcoceras hygrometricum]|uniref:Uncharacterized protein n=1 Tax=Dorcoceras hygrometricum TaxID=472368 RepID=A0A2Z7CLU7_9LAMI|nr:hypothetical protein F511_11936 [Dorcoceras hygrometricum]
MAARCRAKRGVFQRHRALGTAHSPDQRATICTRAVGQCLAITRSSGQRSAAMRGQRAYSARGGAWQPSKFFFCLISKLSYRCNSGNNYVLKDPSLSSDTTVGDNGGSGSRFLGAQRKSKIAPRNNQNEKRHRIGHGAAAHDRWPCPAQRLRTMGASLSRCGRTLGAASREKTSRWTHDGGRAKLLRAGHAQPRLAVELLAVNWRTGRAMVAGRCATGWRIQRRTPRPSRPRAWPRAARKFHAAAASPAKFRRCRYG